jgi:hypothetical protein
LTGVALVKRPAARCSGKSVSMLELGRGGGMVPDVA